MKLKEYIEKLQELYLEHGDLELVYAVDDEGNYYQSLTSNFIIQQIK